MKLYKSEELQPVGVTFKGVKSIVDTSGFMPLESKIKQFMLNGQIANLRSSLFDSYDFREMFDSIPEIVDDAFDDLEEVLNIVSKRHGVDILCIHFKLHFSSRGCTKINVYCTEQTWQDVIPFAIQRVICILLKLYRQNRTWSDNRHFPFEDIK